MTEQLTDERTQSETRQLAPTPIRIPWALVPRVNLMPIEILETRRFRRTQIVLGGAVVSALLIGGAGTYLAQRSINDANDQLVVAEAKVSALQTEQGRYAAVPQVIAEVDAARAARTLAMANDVLWSRYLNDLDDARPAGVYLSAITASLNASGTAGGSANPLSSSGIGTITLSGTAEQYKQVSSWLEGADKVIGISSSSLTSATKAEKIVTFESGAILDSDALSRRYDKEAD
jgi:Tfp pilus assembly protein PilN